MPTIGKLDRRITFERHSETGRDEFNEPVYGWAVVATVWASRRDASDGEREASGQVGSSVMTRFVIRSSSMSRTFTPKDRINYQGFWNIEGIKETVDGRGRFIEVTAIRETD